MSLTTICHIRKVSSYVPFSVNTSTTLVNHVSHNVRYVQRPTCVSFKFKFKFNFENVYSSTLYTILVATLFNTPSFTQSAKAILVCNIFTIIALFLTIYMRFCTKNGGRLIY